jgi:hypothetical protein
MQATTAGQESVSECKAPAVDIVQWSIGAMVSTVGATRQLEKLEWE